VRMEFVKNGSRGDSPEDQLLVQFQGMFAEYEKAQLMERCRRGKAHRARTGSVNVLSGAPFGYRYRRKTGLAGAVYEINEGEAALAAGMFRRYADEGASIAGLARWLTSQGVPTRTGKHRRGPQRGLGHAAQPLWVPVTLSQPLTWCLLPSRAGMFGIWLRGKHALGHLEYSCHYDSRTSQCSACSVGWPCSPGPTGPRTPRF
jgi:Recombinase